MNNSRARFATFAPGLVLFLALMIGGGSASGLSTDAVLQVVTVIVCAGILLTKQSRRIDWLFLALPLAAMGVAAMQIVPLPIGWVSGVWPSAIWQAWQTAGTGAVAGFITGDLAATIAAFAYIATASLLLWTFASLSREQLLGLLPFIAVGFLVHVFAAAFQLSLTGVEPRENILAYPITLGLFSNSNHFATLLLMAIPPLVFGAAGEWRLPAGASLGVVLLFLLAGGSTAGAVAGFAVTLVSFALLGNLKAKSWPVGIAIAACGAFMGYGAWRNILTKGSASLVSRLEFLNTGLEAVRENPVFGTGFGTFVQTYQIYEKAASIGPEYVNHAHDDYLELLMEGGVFAAALIVIYCVFLVTRAAANFKYPLARVCVLSIAVVLAHSFADYPLRTMAILYLFIYAHALMVSDHAGLEAEAARRALAARAQPARNKAAPRLELSATDGRVEKPWANPSA